MWPNLKVTTDLVTFTKEILHGKLQFLCSANTENPRKKWAKVFKFYSNKSDTLVTLFLMLNLTLSFVNGIRRIFNELWSLMLSFQKWELLFQITLSKIAKSFLSQKCRIHSIYFLPMTCNFFIITFKFKDSMDFEAEFRTSYR